MAVVHLGARNMEIPVEGGWVDEKAVCVPPFFTNWGRLRWPEVELAEEPRRLSW